MKISIYVFDSESDNVDNPGFEQGIRIGDALNGWVKYFILDQGGDPRIEHRKRRRVRYCRQIRQRVRGGTPAARSAEIRQGQVVIRVGGRHLNLSRFPHRPRKINIGHDRQTGALRKNFAQNCEPLADKIGRLSREAGDVIAGRARLATRPRPIGSVVYCS